MQAPKLRIADGTLDSNLEEAAFEPSTVRVNAGEILALLMHASRTNRTWLQDFSEETMEVSQDLYEVLLAYKRIAFETNARAA